MRMHNGSHRCLAVLIGLFTLLLSSVSLYSASFVVEPYLLDITQQSAIVAFHLDMPLSAQVHIFNESGMRTIESAEKKKSHFITINDLLPGTSYRYEVVCGSGQVQTPKGNTSFQIRPAALPGESFSFVVFGDPRPGENETPYYHQKIIDQILFYDPMFSLILGDMVDNGDQPEDWHEFFKVESELIRRAAIYPVLGDNDYVMGRGVYPAFFPSLQQQPYYHFEWGDIQFFGLFAWDTRGNQSGREFDSDSPQANWFRTEMMKEEVRDAPFRIVFLHDPVYISRGQSSEMMRRIWIPLFKEYNVNVVFSSWHLYERSLSEGIHYIVSGGAGAELIWLSKNSSFPSLVEAQEHHFCRVDVNSRAMTIQSVGLDGTIFDTTTLLPSAAQSVDKDQLHRNATRLSQKILIHEEYQSRLPLILFSYECSYCKTLLEHDLPRMARSHKISLDITFFDLGKPGIYELLLNAGSDFGRQGTDLPTIFIGNTVLGGETEIKERLPEEIVRFVDNSDQYLEQSIKPFQKKHDTGSIKEQTFDALTWTIVLSAGLLDGINPCAFTTIIFLISYLGLIGTSRKNMVITGSMFSLAVFVTYLAIGIMFYHAIKWIALNQVLAMIVNILLFIVVVAFFIFSLVDFMRCLRGKATDMTLQLPNFLKIQIRERIRNFARNQTAIAGTSFILGVVIAGLELTCTGQVYLPVVTMISNPVHRVTALLYLIAYNVSFILPLLVVFLVVTFGVTSERIAKSFQNHIAKVKLGLALLFLAMASIIAFNLGWLS